LLLVFSVDDLQPLFGCFLFILAGFLDNLIELDLPFLIVLLEVFLRVLLQLVFAVQLLS